MAESIKVFILEDDENFLNILTTKLKTFLTAAEITTCSNLADAKEHFLNNEPCYDVFLIDEHLPDGLGLDLVKENYFENEAVIVISSDSSNELPNKAYRAGVMYFLNKTQIRDDLFEPLIQGIIDRNRIQKKLIFTLVQQAELKAVKTLVSTLRHEINNPLGAVLGAAFLIKNEKSANPEQKQTAELVEQSANRIVHVLNQLCDAIKLNEVSKANELVFHVPGDKEWK